MSSPGTCCWDARHWPPWPPSCWCGGGGSIALPAFLVVYLAESIMFPTIFSLSLRSSGGHTKQASSLLIMTIVGGAIAPVIMGRIADSTGCMALAFTVPLACYIYIMLYSIRE